MPQSITKKAFQSLVLAGWGARTGGSTEFPLGRFSVVKIPDQTGERIQMREAVFSDKPAEAIAFNKIKAGWFFVVQTNDGNVYVNHCRDEKYANQRYEQRERAYLRWMNL